MSKGKRKNSGQNPGSPLSPSAASDRTQKPSDSAVAPSSTSASVPHLPPGPPPSHPPPPPPTTILNPDSTTVWHLVQSLPEDLCVFLEPGYEEKYNKIVKLKFYRILLHFDPATTSRHSHHKADLHDAFKKYVLPRIQPFLLPPAPSPMDTDDSKANLDFNPLGRKTTRKMLSEAIKRKAPNAIIPGAARRDGLLLLYQAHVDPGLVIPGQTQSVRRPHHVKPHAVQDEDMEDLRFALQCHAPNIFIHSNLMTHQVLVDCYLHFLLDEKIPPGSLVRGFHYSIIE